VELLDWTGLDWTGIRGSDVTLELKDGARALLNLGT
jgi:hypothetical protein